MGETSPEPKKPGKPGNPKHKPWTAADDRLLLALRKTGKSYDEIASKLGRSAGSVQQRKSVLNRADGGASGGKGAASKKKAPKRKAKKTAPDAVERSRAKLARIVASDSNGQSSRPDRSARAVPEPPAAHEGDQIHLTVNGVAMEIDGRDVVIIERGTIRIGGTRLTIPRVLA